ncbi:MAG: hypothetical protein IKF35_05510 [Solobacterium sp.]|nr:hypothetical protein [Solobacterium sp.]
MRDHNAGVPEELLVLLHVIMYETRRQALGQQEKDWPQQLRHDILKMIRENESDRDCTDGQIS